MKKILKHSILTFLFGTILSTIIYSISLFKIGNQADIIEFIVRVYFFGIIFLISNVSYALLHYAFNFNDNMIFATTNILIFILILCNHGAEWKNPYLLIYTPVYLTIQCFLVLFSNRKQANK
jgi:hypothetical protein